jgi:hypothetical protein
MAIIRVTLVKDSIRDSLRQGSVRGVGVKVYEVESDTPITADEAIVANDGTTAVDGYGAAFSASRPNCKLTDREMTERRSAYQCQVTVTFEDPTDGSSLASLLAKPARIRELDESWMEEYTKDHDDPPKLVRNVVGEPYDRGPERLEGIVVYEVKKFVNAATRAQIRAARRTNNDAAKTINGVVHSIDELVLWSATFEPVDTIYDATMLIKYKVGGWKDETPQYGFRYWESSAPGGKKFAAILDAFGERVSVAWPLSADGTKKSNADDDPAIETYWPYPQHDWAGVPLS